MAKLTSMEAQLSRIERTSLSQYAGTLSIAFFAIGFSIIVYMGTIDYAPGLRGAVTFINWLIVLGTVSFLALLLAWTSKKVVEEKAREEGHQN